MRACLPSVVYKYAYIHEITRRTGDTTMVFFWGLLVAIILASLHRWGTIAALRRWREGRDGDE